VNELLQQVEILRQDQLKHKQELLHTVPTPIPRAIIQCHTQDSPPATSPSTHPVTPVQLQSTRPSKASKVAPMSLNKVSKVASSFGVSKPVAVLEQAKFKEATVHGAKQISSRPPLPLPSSSILPPQLVMVLSTSPKPSSTAPITPATSL
jgi:hypothetical protein